VEEVESILKAAGIEIALLPMEDNDPEGEADDEGDVDALLGALASIKV
jgi:hypothetical protein